MSRTWSYEGGLIQARVIASTQLEKDFLEAEGISMDSSDLIAFCARVSNPTNQFNTETADKLIDYLIRNKHWSPFEMVNAVIELRLPRDIGRQLLRHQTVRFQEFSQRYAQATDFRLREARMQDGKNRQNSTLLDMANHDDHVLANEWVLQQERVLREAEAAYQWALDKGIAKECARVVLPEGLTMSAMYANANIRSWIHYLQVRLEEGVQMEHRALAYCIAYAVSETFRFFPVKPVFNDAMATVIGERIVGEHISGS